MTSEPEIVRPREAFVWIWLPGRTVPVVAGRIRARDDHFAFTYGRSYLEREGAIPIYAPELPLRRGPIRPEPPLEIAGALRDAAPDAWGRRVIAYRLFAGRGGMREDQPEELGELTFLLLSGSDRIGALDFQPSPGEYAPREASPASLEQLLTAAERVERGLPLSPGLADALLHGTSIGGAMPKAQIREGNKQYIAKFLYPTSLPYNLVKAEFVAMRLANLAGLDVAPVRLTRCMDKDVLLVQRFDRDHTEEGVTRRAMVSALTLFGLDERLAAYASYEYLADILRARAIAPRETLAELFSRMTFNILSGNTDDHARNHAAFWDGSRLALTPAYDICPQPRTGREASQAMRIHGQERRAQLSLCLAAAPKFLLSEDRALAIMSRQITAISDNWEAVCDEAALGIADRRLLWRRQFLNDLAFDGLKNRLAL
ncbi:MAG: type II toxin-antitoxin system HipA family toxin [Gammaproteobacteria bacterium]|nr:type II toxin-antitoxin system HipA family toxin [Gammaproteobacteria bacterium]